MNNEVHLSFKDYTDLQTRLILLPRVEEEGVGAVISCYEECNVDGEETATDQPTLACKSLTGYVVKGLAGNEIEWLDEEFSSILAAIRQAECPIELVVIAPNEPPSNSFAQIEEEKKVDGDGDNNEEDQTDALMKQNAVKDTENALSNARTSQESLLGDFSSWTSRMRATSAHLAAGAASISSAMATAAKERAKSGIKETSQKESPSQTTVPYGLFIQSSSGAFMPLDQHSANVRPDHQITNSSLIVVRKSAAEPCPLKNHRFQWYRSSDSEDSKWTELVSATNAAFQPSAVEVGHRIRCIVSVDNQEDYLASREDSDSESEIERHVCESEDVVRAALPLFNGARQALVRGAQFSGIVGRGKAEGRHFRLTVDSKTVSDTENQSEVTACAITIYQVCGSTAEPMHPVDQPIICVSAAADYGFPKAFDLVLSEHLPPSASMVAALSDNGRLSLQAANRLARESLLLTIGITNYRGKTSDLNESSILFWDKEVDPDQVDCLHEYEAKPENENVDEKVHANIIDTAPESHHGPLIPEHRTSYRDRLVRSVSLGSVSMVDQNTSNAQRFDEEINLLRAKLTRKDKIISELQRQITHSDASLRETERKLKSMEDENRGLMDSNEATLGRLAAIENKIKRQEVLHEESEKRLKLQLEHEKSLLSQENNKVKELEKTVRTLQNEKAVLSATIEARESKLAKMAEMQNSLHEKSILEEEKRTLQREIVESRAQIEILNSRLDKAEEQHRTFEAEIAGLKSTIERYNRDINNQKQVAASYQSEVETQRMKIQKLKAERNSYKQKGESLAKEMARVCRNGRSVREVERIVLDEASRREEVAVLREQKQKALEEVEQYRLAYEHSRAAQKMAGLDQDSAKILERNAELERLLSELTEYVTAKEMQMETLKQVNEALQGEIHDLAKAHMNKNDV